PPRTGCGAGVAGQPVPDGRPTVVVRVAVAGAGGGGVGQPVADGRAPYACHRGRRAGVAPGGGTRGPGGDGAPGPPAAEGAAGSARTGPRPPCGRAARVAAGIGPSGVGLVGGRPGRGGWTCRCWCRWLLACWWLCRWVAGWRTARGPALAPARPRSN